MKVSFVLLAHESPARLKPLITALLSAGADVFVHHDRNAPYDLALTSKEWDLEQYDGQLYFAPRIRVVWGEWSIVQATLNCLYLARENGCTYDYMMLISGSCMPIKPLEELAGYLNSNPFDFIECVDANKVRWVTDGIQEERWGYYHYVNWRKNRRLFSLSNAVQKKLKINRKLPQQLEPFIGSQWWCLRASTINQILTFLDDHPQAIRFYRRTWVPDESFFQTLVGNLIPGNELNNQLLTRYTFNSWGIPRVYYDNDFAELVKDFKFFARKISHRASDLKLKLSELAQMSHDEFEYACETKYLPELQKFQNEQRLNKNFQERAWNSYFLSESNEYDFLQSISKQIVVLCSLDQSLKKQCIEKINSKDIIAYGDILSKDTIDYGHGVKAVAGYSNAAIKVAHQYWANFIGDLAAEHPRNHPLIFTMGEEAFTYLKYFKWCASLKIVLCDDGSQMPVSGATSDLLHVFLRRKLFPFYEYNNKVLAQVKGGRCQCVFLPHTQSSLLDSDFRKSELLSLDL